ncbi:MAG: signal peptidase II [Bifidobacteriaceae bacterium]|nr:signal peptidase II [Bifidobacteriaceae bacterium]
MSQPATKAEADVPEPEHEHAAEAASRTAAEDADAASQAAAEGEDAAEAASRTAAEDADAASQAAADAVAAGEAPETAPEPDPARRRQLIWLVGVAAAVLAIDQLTKAWAVGALGGGRAICLLGSFLQLHLVRNPGAAFSLGESFTIAFTALAAGVAVAVIVIARRVRSRVWAVVLGLLLGGAVGNLADRLFRPPGPGAGHVVDFIDYAGLFVGNVADIAIVLAALVMILTVLRGVSLDGTKR